MNYLAHLYLSGDNEELMVGNFIADAVKGNKLDHYSPGIREGIIMHRSIDSYTDTSKFVLETNKIFNPIYGKYSGVITDMVFDHFLAKSWNSYHQKPLTNYVDFVNLTLIKYFAVMPKRMQLIMPFWVKHRWPEIYQTAEGLKRALLGMPKYTTLPNKGEPFLELFCEAKNEVEKNFQLFFEAVRQKFANKNKSN